MELLEYVNTLSTEDQADFAARCGTSIGYIRLIAYGARRCREALAINIDRESGGVVKMGVLRPDVDWGYVISQKQGQQI